jgi:hypothetical protein
MTVRTGIGFLCAVVGWYVVRELLSLFFSIAIGVVIDRTYGQTPDALMPYIVVSSALLAAVLAIWPAVKIYNKIAQPTK